MTPEQRGDFVNSAAGKFKDRAQAALRTGHLGSVVTVPEVTIEGEVPAATPPAPVVANDDPIVAGCVGGQCYLNIRQSRFEQLEEEAKVARALRTLENVSGGPLGATGYLIGTASSEDPNVQGAASDVGALGDQVLQAAGTAEQISPEKSTRQPEPTRATATGSIDPGLKDARSDLLRTLGQRQRTLELSEDPAVGAKRISEGIAGVRIEDAAGRTVSRGTHEGIDLTGGGLGNISLKGPVRSRGGEPIPITEKMVRGLAMSVIDGANNNSAVDVVVVDTLGLTQTQTALLFGLIAAAGPTKKPIRFLR